MCTWPDKKLLVLHRWSYHRSALSLMVVISRVKLGNNWLKSLECMRSQFGYLHKHKTDRGQKAQILLGSKNQYLENQKPGFHYANSPQCPSENKWYSVYLELNLHVAWEYHPALCQTCGKKRCKTPVIFIENYGRTVGRQRLHWMSFLLLFNPLFASWKMCWKLSLCLKYSWTNTRDTIAHFCQETLLSAARYFALAMKNEQLMYRWDFSIATIGAVKNISKIL